MISDAKRKFIRLIYVSTNTDFIKYVALPTRYNLPY